MRFFQQLREGHVAEIFQQHQAVRLVARQDFRRAETQLPEMGVNPVKRRDGFRQLRGVHQDGGLAAPAQTDIFARGGVADERFTGGVAPAGGGEKFACVVVGHVPTV